MIKDNSCDQEAGRLIRVCQEQQHDANDANETQSECVIPPGTFELVSNDVNLPIYTCTKGLTYPELRLKPCRLQTINDSTRAGTQTTISTMETIRFASRVMIDSSAQTGLIFQFCKYVCSSTILEFMKVSEPVASWIPYIVRRKSTTPSAKMIIAYLLH